MDKVEAIVIGAGVVGIAIARELALAGREVVVLEAADAIGTQTSARNSEVIHAGIYYPPGSLMARLCVEGRRQLYAYCESRGIPHRRCGKLIVATSAVEREQLTAISARAAANGVEGMRVLDAGEARAMEPALAVTGALLSPETGILDSHAYMLALRGEAEESGTFFAFETPFLSAEPAVEGFIVAAGGAQPMQLACKLLINAAGLQAPDAARRIGGLGGAHVPRAYYAKGSYFTLSGRAPFSRLIYPVPAPGGLGVHLTLDMGGAAKFGPDVEWVDRIDYRVDPARGVRFYEAIRRYWPALPEGALEPGYAGIRPKIAPAEAGTQDFRIDGPERHGIAGLVNLFGIESPGLTASLALAGEVQRRVQ